VRVAGPSAQGLVGGLPEDLPAGETLLWQGSPSWRSLARHCCHVPVVAAYFALLLAFSAVCSDWHGSALVGTALSLLRLAGLALVALGLLMLFAVLVQRTTIYSVTNRRVVLSFGIAMPMSINLPFRVIETAALRPYADGSGDIAITLLPAPRQPAYVVLWPHARPWRMTRPQPMLRGLPDAARVAQILGRSLAASAEQPAPAAPVALDAHAGSQRPRAPAAA
jgi:hypothetical protein